MTNDRSVCHKYCSINTKEFENSLQITKMIVQARQTLGICLSKELSESKIKFSASNFLMGLSPII